MIKLKQLLESTVQQIQTINNIKQLDLEQFNQIVEFFQKNKNLFTQINSQNRKLQITLNKVIKQIFQKVKLVQNYLTFNPMKRLKSHFKSQWLRDLQNEINTLIIILNKFISFKEYELQFIKFQLNSLVTKRK